MGDYKAMRLRKSKNVQKPDRIKQEKKERPHLKKVMAWGICVLLLGLIAVMIFARIFPDNGTLRIPENMIADTVTPAQNVFSSIVDAVVGYLRTLKLRSNLEYEYNRLKDENAQLVYQAMRVDELEIKLSAYADIHDEMIANASMNPIMCTVIGRESGNYFSVFTINKGLNDGVEDYMAVTISGALVGYTYSVSANKALVRTIIDSEASIAGLIQSSRDQGTIRGTLGIDGQPMCRMYYLPDDRLPRPGDTVVTSGIGMSFPKGIPIGTVRESTRGMDANKQYIVVEPTVDFQHIENVIVLRYKPDAGAVVAQGGVNGADEFLPLETKRPYPELQVGGNIITFGTPSPSPDPNATTTPEPTPTATPLAGENTIVPDISLEYQVPGTPPEETTVPATPTPSPVPTFSPDQLTVEGD